MTPIERFLGPGSRENLLEAMRSQFLVQGNSSLAEALAHASALVQFGPGDRLVQQDGADNDIYFLLFGEVAISVNGREMARRHAGLHIGEMAVVDPSARRAATVEARTEVVAARVLCADFCRIAANHPDLWRRVASQLGTRLRQRTDFVRSKNQTPILFIGSSSESLPVVRALVEGLRDAPFIVRPWTGSIFTASQFPIDDLARQVNECDFSALVLGPDDEVICRGVASSAPRDNVMFELGLFMGAIERPRTFLVVPRDVDVKIPTDLLGLNQLRVAFASGDLVKDVEEASASICAIVARLGAR